MNFLAALRFLTIIPLPGRGEVKPEGIGRSIGYFPVVGALLGFILLGLNWLLGLILPPAIVPALLIVCQVIISGALHLDGFVDTCDGIGGQKTVEARWRVMHDSRVGGFGVVGACCLLLVKYISLNSVPEPLLMATLMLMPILSRWAMVYAVCVYPSARASSLGKIVKQEASRQRFIIATVITLLLAIGSARLTNTVYFYLVGLAIMFGIWVIVMAVASYLKHKFSGLTGDTYGAINEIAEVCVPILVCLLAHNHWLGLT